MNTYFLFGKDAVNFYHWGEESKEEKARILLNEYTYDPWDVCCYDSLSELPKQPNVIIIDNRIYTEYCVITEEFYNLLK